MDKLFTLSLFLMLSALLFSASVYAEPDDSYDTSIDVQSLLADSVLAPVVSEYLSCCLPLSDLTVTSAYGQREDPFSGNRSSHNGLDLRARYETVYSMLDGLVVAVSRDKRSGLYITIRHGEFLVSYCHLSRVNVSKGETVVAGQPLAVTGNSGRSTAPHLHITCRFRGSYVDPAILLQYISDVRTKAFRRLTSLIQSRRTE